MGLKIKIKKKMLSAVGCIYNPRDYQEASQLTWITQPIPETREPLPQNKMEEKN